jgi:hypothetical protein
MQADLTEERLQAHTLLDSLDADQLAAVRHLLEVMVEPLARSLANAPVEEEQINDETAKAPQLRHGCIHERSCRRSPLD